VLPTMDVEHRSRRKFGRITITERVSREDGAMISEALFDISAES
jgi:hypothetical protein